MGLFGFSLGGDKTTQHHTQGVDTNTYNQLGSIYNAYQQAGNAGPSPLLTQAGQYGSQAQRAGNLGFSALTGNPYAMASFMNPYQGQVIDAMNQQLDRADQIGTNVINSQATQAGAFGGSRQGVAQGTMLAANALNANQQIGGLLQSGFNNAQGVAQNLAGYGFQGAGLNANLGFGGVGSPSQWYAQQLKQGFIMPTGTQSGDTTSKGGFGFHIG